LFSQATTRAPTHRAMRKVAASVGNEMTNRAAAHTPKRTGRIAGLWRTLPVEPTPEGFRSGTTNPSYVARFLEHGVEPHELKPKRGQALGTPEGPRAHAHHPGFGGAHMLAKAMGEVEAIFPALAQPHMTAWAKEIEEVAKRHPGVS
jgi:hypothetical protein